MSIVSSRILAGILSLAALGAASAAFAADAPAAASSAATYEVPKGTPAYVRKAVESKSRSAEQTARDANRKPAEVLTLSGVKPGDQVVEFASFGQYFTTMLSDIVGPLFRVGQVVHVDLALRADDVGQHRGEVLAERSKLHDLVARLHA